jgi:hypothetical protein
MWKRTERLMIIKLKLVPKCEGNCSGICIIHSANVCEIQISKKRNKTIDVFADTLLHELLHLWVTILQTHGLKEDMKIEHKFIADVLPMILKKLAKYFK